MTKIATDIEFSLLAPYNKSVVLQGEFSDWQDLPMHKGSDGIWRCRVALEDGAWWYRFKLKTRSPFWESDTWVEIIDPYARTVDEVKRAGQIRIENGDIVFAPYHWRHDGEQLADPYARISYELYLGDFSGTRKQVGTFDGLRQKLDYLTELGISEILCMPVMAVPGRKSWGYNPAWLFATEKAFGSPEELKSLIDECHHRGLRFIGDMLFNHVTQDCPLTWIDYHYWFREQPSDPEWNWGPEWNYDYYDEVHQRWPAWEFNCELLDFWLEEFHFDGIRYDAVKQLDHPRFLAWITERAHQRQRGELFVNLAEYIPDEPKLVTDGPMDATWHDSYCHIIRNVMREQEQEPETFKQALNPRLRGYTSPLQVYNYLSTHDQGRFISCMLEAGLSPQQALQRYQLASVLLLTGWGIPMIRMGDEWGEVHWRWFESQHELTPLDWESLTREPGRHLYQLYQQLIQLRQAHPALQRGEVKFIWEQGLAMVYLREYAQDQVLVAVNPSNQNHQLTLDLPGDWKRFMSGEASDAQNLKLQLEPWTAQVWEFV